MAKEMMIIFVYDMEYCKSEEDDPARAVVYFHPGWVSDQQRSSLCGQVMGAAHFLEAVLAPPTVIALQSGKFRLHRAGRYMLAVGTDRNIDDWVLEHRANILKSLITFFHSDLETVSQLSQNQTNLSEKLYSMFETYLRILQYSGNTFSNSPLLNLPKSASSVFLEAIQILQYCQEMKTVLGGTMLYHNKVLATQLSADLTKTLVMTDPYRIKSPAEVVQTTYALPLGVQLLYVYINSKEHRNLTGNSARLRGLSDPVCRTQQKKTHPQKVSKEPVLSAMKRDQSLLFTTVPEEDSDHQSPSSSTTETIVRPKHERAKHDRPKSLSLKFTTTDTAPEKPVNPACTPFAGKTSVCSTPMTEKFLHGTALNIISNADIELADMVLTAQSKDKGTTEGQKTLKKGHNTQQDTVMDSQKLLKKAQQENTQDLLVDSQKTFRSESLNSILSAAEMDLVKKSFNDEFKLPVSNLFLPCNNILDRKKSTSVLTPKSVNKNVMMRYYGIGLTSLSANVQENEPEKHLYNTITDPMYPVFRADGLVISKPMYDLCLSKHCEMFTNEFGKDMFGCENNVNSITNTEDWKSVDDFDSEMKESPKKVLNKEVTSSAVVNPVETPADEDNKQLPPTSRRSLSLPLKSLSTESTESTFSGFNRKNTGGVQLTPLMSKLSLLAMEDRSSGFCSRDTTPMSEYRDLLTPVDRSYSFLRRNSVKKEPEIVEDEKEEVFHKSVLFVCGQQDMVLGMLLEEQAAQNEELIRTLWDVCTETLCRLEMQLRQCLEPYPACAERGETYSYLCVDPLWDTTKRGGPWGVHELGALTHLHREFSRTPCLTEITLRNEDGIIYAYRCGESEVYYQQAATCNSGLPPPADPMGVAPLKARRKLERDHAIILL